MKGQKQKISDLIGHQTQEHDLKSSYTQHYYKEQPNTSNQKNELYNNLTVSRQLITDDHQSVDNDKMETQKRQNKQQDEKPLATRIKEKKEKQIEQKKKELKIDSRQLGNTAFEAVFQKPMFANFGGMNTMQPKTFEGKYMASHNVKSQKKIVPKDNGVIEKRYIKNDKDKMHQTRKEEFDSIQKRVQSAKYDNSHQIPLKLVEHEQQWGIYKKEALPSYHNKKHLMYQKRHKEMEQIRKQELIKQDEIDRQMFRRQIAQLDWQQKQLIKAKKEYVTGKVNVASQNYETGNFLNQFHEIAAEVEHKQRQKNNAKERLGCII